MSYIKTLTNNRKNLITGLAVLVLTLQLFLPVLIPKAHAGTLANTLVRFDRMNASQATTGTVCATASASGAGTEASVKVTFPTGYTLGTAGNFTVTTTSTGWPSGASAWPGIGTATTVSGQDVTFPSNDITDTSLHCFNWNNSAAVTNKSSATNPNTGSVTTQTSAPATIDSGSYATSTVGASCSGVGCDQISVSASVNATFSFSLSSNATGNLALSTSSPTASSAINATVSTNATHGWQMWAADPGSPVGLHSTLASKTIAYSPTVGSAAAALSNGVEGYNLGGGTASGTTCTGVTTDANFASGGTSYKGGGLDNTLRSLAVATGAADTCALPLTVNASISGTTPAASDYADTITVVAAGNF